MKKKELILNSGFTGITPNIARKLIKLINLLKEQNMNDDVKEILLILQEECAEVIQAISKCSRFGPDQIKPGKEVTNISMLEEELGDVLAMIELLVDKKVGVTNEGLEKAKRKKFEKLKSWSNITINK